MTNDQTTVQRDERPSASVQVTAPTATIPVMRPLLPSAEALLPYLRRMDQARIYSNWGPLTSELEQRLARLLGTESTSVVTASSGTAALVGAILASGGRASRQRPLALMPSFTFVATATAAEQCGYQPCLMDVDADTWMLDPDRVAQFSELHRVGVVIPVAPFGRGVPMAKWRALRQATGIPVVIDGAASLECAIDSPDTFLDETIPLALSFHATKSFAMGEGGCVIIRNADAAAQVIQALNFGFRNSRESQISHINGKLSEYHAAVGLAELDGWDAKRTAWRAVADLYRYQLNRYGLDNRYVGAPEIAGCYAIFRCQSAFEADCVKRALQRHAVDCRHWYGAGLHRHSYFALSERERIMATDELAPLLVGLPMAQDLNARSVARIAGALAEGVADAH